ncbi:MAG TPA: enoyl-CoA hydratase-related protein [Amycolatopsis sp.]|uniref:enoyl-CoA hydratase/isomerase family protein n=1 Tax=unclassified Amycolatopsis TaxID=2618356 RepID=UPI00106EDD4F|nr:MULTISPECIES: enoyl-CoA hydratase-related protein [unclassified Amycolatopsis]HWD05741.1 enoyl-CoA hydratase-related protein [Amycolatopsis sp.]
MSDNVVVRRSAGAGVEVCTLKRPPANALGLPIIDGLHAALDEAADAKVVVISSEVPGFFAAGADIKHMSSIDAKSFTEYGDKLRGLLDRVASPDRITIAAVDGLALGGGLELAMACSLRVGSAAAKFGLPEVKLGLIPGAGGTQRLPRLVGRGRALDIMLTGRQVPAEEAHAMGLIDRLVPAGTAEKAALDLAGELAGLSLPAQQAVIRTVDAAFDLPLEQGFRFEVEQEQELFESGEAQEGLSAFLAKRPPNFA